MKALSVTLSVIFCSFFSLVFSSLVFASATTFSVVEGTVVRVEPNYQTRVTYYKPPCSMERVPVQVTSGDRNYGGAIIGGLVGGLLGNQIGGGSGKKWATAAGAATGAIVGDNMASSGGSQAVSTQYRVEEVCPPPVERQERVATSYTVTAWVPSLGKEVVFSMNSDPGMGKTIQLQMNCSVSPMSGGNVGW